MKFGSHLSQQMFMPWSSYYLQYDRIKAMIREEPQDFEEIYEWVQTEFNKIYTFLSQKTDALAYQLQLLEPASSRSLDDLIYPLYDLNELVRYLNLSITGFEKILKSMGKRHPCKSTLQSLPISLDKCYQPLHELLIRIDHIKQKRSLCKKGLFSFPPSIMRPLPPDPGEDQRSTFYYWIHPDYAFELKAILLFYCNLDDHYSLSSTYLDNSQWEVYHSLLNEPSSESIELHWRNASTRPIVQVNHRLKSDNGNDYIKRHSMPQTLVDSLFRPLPPIKDDYSTRTALVVEPKTKNISSGLLLAPKKKDANCKLMDSTRGRIQQSDWKPRVTCTRQRSTFTPTDNKNSIGIHVDTNFSVYKEETSKRPTGLSMMAVTQSAKTPLMTEWLKQLVDNNEWIQPVPRFSYHIHFVSQHFYDQVAFLPWWLDSFDRLWRTKEITRTGLSWSSDFKPLYFRVSPPWHSYLIVDMDDDDNNNINDDKKPLLLKPTKPVKKARWTKVEPKVFFANERTFLSWLQFCALLLTVSLNMINFGGQDDHVSRGCGAMFMILTILMALYALAKYEFRAWHLLTQSTQYRFDDIYGPAILCVLLVVAMLINIGLRLNTPSLQHASLD